MLTGSIHVYNTVNTNIGGLVCRLSSSTLVNISCTINITKSGASSTKIGGLVIYIDEEKDYVFNRLVLS